MIYLISGGDIVSSRSFLLKLKGQYTSVTTIDLKKTKELVLPNTSDLYSTKNLVVLENFNPKDQKKLESLADYDIAIWFDNEVQKPQWVDKHLVFKLQEQVSTYKLADYVGYGQEKAALISVRKLLESGTSSELILGSLVRQFKLLALTLKGENEKVSSSHFLRGKISEQARNWNQKKVKQALFLLLKSDIFLKKGQLNPENALSIAVIDICRLVKANP